MVLRSSRSTALYFSSSPEMKQKIKKTQLIHALAAVSKGMSSRSTMPILSGVLMIASDNQLTLQSTDLEISIQNKTAALIEEEGETVVPGRLFTEIIKSLPEASVVIEEKGSGLTVFCGESSFMVSTLNPMDFPSFPTVDIDRQVIVEAKDLQKLVKKAAKAVSGDESRPVLMGVLIKVIEGRLVFVATDSYRLAVVEKEINNTGEFELIVPGAVLEEVARISVGEENIVIAESENQIIFTSGQTIFVSRKIEGNYPNYEVLIPKERTISAVINASAFLTAIKRVAVASQANGPIKLTFDPATQKLTINSKTLDVASGSETIEAEIEGEYLEIGFNHQYITDGLSVIDEEEVLFENQGALKSGVLKTTGEEQFLYLTMPLRIDI
jgi:DNA polymerase-3 subunit beta